MHVRYMNLRHRKISHTLSAHLAFVDNGSNTTTITNKNNNNNNEQCKKRLRTYERNANNILAKCAKRDKAKQWRDDHSYSGSREKKTEEIIALKISAVKQPVTFICDLSVCVCGRERCEMWKTNTSRPIGPTSNPFSKYSTPFAHTTYLSIHLFIHLCTSKVESQSRIWFECCKANRRHLQ